MDYEIDIEEHDVLDNPVIKTIFPDISVIKKEITQYFEEDLNSEEETETATKLHDKPEDLCNGNASNILVKVEYDTVTEKESLQNTQSNKIILGTKAKITKISKQFVIDSNPFKTNNYNDINIVGFVGSKYNEDIQDDTAVEICKTTTANSNNDYSPQPQILANFNRLHGQNIKLKEIKLVLQDIKSYLNQNGRYCKECCRLFLSKNALDIHLKKLHHKECVYKSINVKNIATHSQYKCSICGTCISNKSNLLRHYKNVHNKNTKLRKNIINTTQNIKSEKSSINNYKFHLNKNNKNTKTKTMKSSIQCNFCGLSLTTYGSLTRHLKRKHTTNTNKHNTKNLKKKQALKYNKTVTVKEKAQITLDIKPNMNSTPDIQINKYILSVTKQNVTIDEHAKQTKSEVIHKKQKLCKEKCLTEESVIVNNEKDTESHLVDNGSKVHTKYGDVKSNYEVTSKNQDSPTDSNVCSHCNKDFADQKALIEHMYEVLKPKNGSVKEQTIVPKKDNMILYMCRQCSYYLPSVESYFAHLSRNHKTETFLEANKKEFDAQCKHCPFKAFNIRTYNRHVHSYHIDLMFSRMKSEIENTGKKYIVNKHDNLFALESVIFECNKCSICFLSSYIAKDHIKHNIDSLNNWQCPICKHFFKEQDKDLHNKQHSFSQTLKVYNLNEDAISNVLYNCTKCAIHFTEKRYQEHFINCGSVPTDSSYCNKCDILIDKKEINFHKSQHEQLKDLFDFIIIDSSIILDKGMKKRGKNSEPQLKFKKRCYEQNNSLTYCPTCKSYLSYSGLKNESHISKICYRLHTYPCDECGLLFTSSTLEKHKERHEKEKNLKLQDFKFFDFQGLQIRPAMPEYPQCIKCNIQFLKKKCISRHICGYTEFFTCDICSIKLSEITYKLHMAFHLYVMYKGTPENGSMDVKKEQNLLYKLAKHESYVVSKKSTQFDSKLQIESNKFKPDKKLKNKTNTIILGHKSVDSLQDAGMEVIEIEDSQTEKIIDLVDETNIDPNSEDNSLVVMFTCKPCGITVESYDEVIKHCQAHYIGKDTTLVASVKNCNKCGLKFDIRLISNHERKAHSGDSKIEILKFDPCYFPLNNIDWVKRIFQHLNKEIVKDLMKNSIYQHEHRILMEYSQKGTMPYYIYKCDSCGNCVDPASVYVHAKNSCSEVQKYSCTWCNLTFLTIFSRSNHEKLHRQIKHLKIRSLNIVLFNQNKDKTFNSLIFSTLNQYVFYQCRNCDKVAEKTFLDDHVCDKNALVKCSTCALLLSSEDFEAHSSKHKQLGNFCSDNFKVILIGSQNSNIQTNASKTISPSFSGTVYDYTFNKCEICKMCLKNHESTEKHTCIPNFELDRLVCSECGLNFPSGNMRHHMKQHKTDPHFIKENMNIITFNNKNTNTTVKRKVAVTNEYRKNIVNNEWKKRDDGIKKSNNVEKVLNNTEIDCTQNIKLKSNLEKPINCNVCMKSYKTVKENDKYDCGCSHTTENNMELSKYINEAVDKLYQCKCGLHFLDKLKAQEHTKKCHPKELRQKCSKCHLLFNSSELFSHLLVHHKDKTKVHNFKIIAEFN